MLLSNLKTIGQTLKVVAFACDQDSVSVQRLQDLGIVVGKSIKILQYMPFGGPVIVQIGMSVFSISREIARCVNVELSV